MNKNDGYWIFDVALAILWVIGSVLLVAGVIQVVWFMP